jgi:hypothetical protein
MAFIMLYKDTSANRPGAGGYPVFEHLAMSSDITFLGLGSGLDEIGFVLRISCKGLQHDWAWHSVEWHTG